MFPFFLIWVPIGLYYISKTLRDRFGKSVSSDSDAEQNGTLVGATFTNPDTSDAGLNSDVILMAETESALVTEEQTIKPGTAITVDSSCSVPLLEERPALASDYLITKPDDLQPTQQQQQHQQHCQQHQQQLQQQQQVQQKAEEHAHLIKAVKEPMDRDDVANAVLVPEAVRNLAKVFQPVDHVEPDQVQSDPEHRKELHEEVRTEHGNLVEPEQDGSSMVEEHTVKWNLEAVRFGAGNTECEIRSKIQDVQQEAQIDGQGEEKLSNNREDLEFQLELDQIHYVSESNQGEPNDQLEIYHEPEEQIEQENCLELVEIDQEQLESNEVGQDNHELDIEQEERQSDKVEQEDQLESDEVEQEDQQEDQLLSEPEDQIASVEVGLEDQHHDKDPADKVQRDQFADIEQEDSPDVVEQRGQFTSVYEDQLLSDDFKQLASAYEDQLLSEDVEQGYQLALTQLLSDNVDQEYQHTLAEVEQDQLESHDLEDLPASGQQGQLEEDQQHEHHPALNEVWKEDQFESDDVGKEDHLASEQEDRSEVEEEDQHVLAEVEQDQLESYDHEDLPASGQKDQLEKDQQHENHLALNEVGKEDQFESDGFEKEDHLASEQEDQSEVEEEAQLASGQEDQLASWQEDQLASWQEDQLASWQEDQFDVKKEDQHASGQHEIGAEDQLTNQLESDEVGKDQLDNERNNQDLVEVEEDQLESDQVEENEQDYPDESDDQLQVDEVGQAEEGTEATAITSSIEEHYHHVLPMRRARISEEPYFSTEQNSQLPIGHRPRGLASRNQSQMADGEGLVMWTPPASLSTYPACPAQQGDPVYMWNGPAESLPPPQARDNHSQYLVTEDQAVENDTYYQSYYTLFVPTPYYTYRVIPK